MYLYQPTSNKNLKWLIREKNAVIVATETCKSRMLKGKEGEKLHGNNAK